MWGTVILVRQRVSMLLCVCWGVFLQVVLVLRTVVYVFRAWRIRGVCVGGTVTDMLSRGELSGTLSFGGKASVPLIHFLIGPCSSCTTLSVSLPVFFSLSSLSLSIEVFFFWSLYIYHSSSLLLHSSQHIVRGALPVTHTLRFKCCSSPCVGAWHIVCKSKELTEEEAGCTMFSLVDVGRWVLVFLRLL